MYIALIIFSVLGLELVLKLLKLFYFKILVYYYIKELAIIT